ncbi:MAG: CotH kinase family protein [Gemmataceae bacterium]
MRPGQCRGPELPNPLLERIVAEPVLLDRYRNEARKILDRSFEPKKLCKIVDAKYAVIKDDLKADPFPHRRATVPGDRSYDDIIDSIKVFINKRYASALKQLDDPGERPKAERIVGFSPQLAAKIHLIQKRATEMQRAGKDVSPIARLMQQLEAAIRAGRMEEAEAIVAEALKQVDGNK